MKRRIQAVLLGALAMALLPSYAAAAIRTQCPNDNDPADTDANGNKFDDNVCLHLAAGDGFLKMGDGTVLYAFGFSNVTGVPNKSVMDAGMLASELPAPTIKIREGKRLYLNLSNVGMIMRPDLFDPHSVHWHGFPQAAPIFDGVPEASATINMGSTFTYFYAVEDPGTYIYHCHVEASEHMQMGMLGNLYVTPKQDGQSFTHEGRTYTKFAYNDGDGSTGYDVDVPIQLHGMDRTFHELHLAVQPLPFAFMRDNYLMLNGRGYPDTINPAALNNASPDNPKPLDAQKIDARIRATKGQRILLRISSLVTTHHMTLASPSIPMRIVGMGAKQLKGPTGRDLSYTTTSVTLGGGETVDALLDTRDLAPGTYFLYSTNLNYLANDGEDRGGPMTEIVIAAP
jgi:FtsP/CotA-like multicopper oxidase with cupredoxin domain